MLVYQRVSTISPSCSSYRSSLFITLSWDIWICWGELCGKVPQSWSQNTEHCIGSVVSCLPSFEDKFTCKSCKSSNEYFESQSNQEKHSLKSMAIPDINFSNTFFPDIIISKKRPWWIPCQLTKKNLSIRWMVAKSESPVENGGGKHPGNFVWVSTMLWVMQDFTTIHSLISFGWVCNPLVN